MLKYDEALKHFIEANVFNSRGFVNTNKLEIYMLNKDLKESYMLQEISNMFGAEGKELIYIILNGIIKKPVCKSCGAPVKFLGFRKGYRLFCSRKCAGSDLDEIEKRKETLISRYGTDHNFKISAVKDKIKQTNLQKYGVENVSQSKIIRDKIKQTNLQRYSANTPLSNEGIRDKIKQTNLQKYGYEHFTQTEDYKIKSENTCFQRYGKEHVSQVEIFKDRKYKTLKEKSFDTFVLLLKSKMFSLTSNKEECLNNSSFNLKCDLCGNILTKESFCIRKISCDCRKHISLGEKDIANWLKSIGIDVIENDREVLDGKELDIYIPEHKLAIEYNGLYWHCELEKDKNYHLTKTLECQKKGIQLIHVFENEWKDEIKQKIVKSIIKAKFGIFDERIYARKCEIKELSSLECDEFLELNHLQGKSIAKTRLGLFYNDELVSVMSFSKSRFKKDETELIRFANKLGTSILGGFSKLLKYYVVNYKPDVLISYCDLRYFDGSGYLKNGFRIIEKTNIGYKYWEYNTLDLYSRVQFQKHKLKDKLEIYDENLSEHENMLNNKYYRIYDCGNLKLKYKNL